MSSSGDSMKCTILYDTVAGKGFDSGFGFSCLVEAGGKKILFDTGEDGRLLLSNMKKFDISQKEIDAVFISHAHVDHASGLTSFLNVRKEIPVYVPASAAEAFKAEFEAKITGISNSMKIYEGIYSTGELGSRLKEQSLVVKTKKGNIIITGCGHPGLGNIIEKAREFGVVYGLIGGFHKLDNPDKLSGLKLIAPCHCTMDKQEILARFPNAAIGCMAGAVFEVE